MNTSEFIKNRAGIGEVDEIRIMEKGKDIFGKNNLKISKLRKRKKESPFPSHVVLKGMGSFEINPTHIRQVKEFYDYLDKRVENPFDMKNPKNASNRAQNLYKSYKNNPYEISLLMLLQKIYANKAEVPSVEDAREVIKKMRNAKEK